MPDPMTGVGRPGAAFGPPGPVPVTDPRSGYWVLATNGREEELDIAELRARIRAGQVKADDLCAPVGQQVKPAREHGALDGALGMRSAAGRPRVSGARAAGGFPKGIAVAALVVAALGVVGVGALKFLPELFEGQTEAGVNPLRRVRPVWQRQFPDVDGTAKEHLDEGRKQMSLDTASGFRKADEELRQALLLDVGNVAAIAAWAENLANSPTARADLETTALARDAVEYGLKKKPNDLELTRALAAIRFVQGSPDDAQRLLRKAKERAPNDVGTLLWLARTNLDRSPQDALTIVQREIRAKSPDLRAAYTIEGAAQRRLGAFREAREMLAARLVSDPSHVLALKELAKLELDVGNADAAITALSRLIDVEDKDVEAWLLRAKIAAQIKGGVEATQTADAQLQEVLQKHEAAAGELLLPVLAHATSVKTQLGQHDAAIALGERARSTDPSYPAALFALGMAYDAKGEVENAKRTLEQAVRASEQRDPFNEPLIRAELSRLQALAGDEQNAIRNSERVIDADPRHVRAHFGLAAIFMKNKKPAQAMTVIRRAFANDPRWNSDRRVITDYPRGSQDLVAIAERFREAAATNTDSALAPQLAAAECVVRFHAGQLAEASPRCTAALRLDARNDIALLYQGVIDLELGRPAEARAVLRRALEQDERHVMVRLYAARADHVAGELDGARRQFQALIEAEPTMVQARYSLGMVLRSLKLEAQARNELRTVVQQDPDYLPAKQALAEQ
jgi:tetratricopeptide (TPR) repeat protein